MTYRQDSERSLREYRQRKLWKCIRSSKVYWSIMLALLPIYLLVKKAGRTESISIILATGLISTHIYA